jgi:hypothetical protein
LWPADLWLRRDKHAGGPKFERNFPCLSDGDTHPPGMFSAPPDGGAE